MLAVAKRLLLPKPKTGVAARLLAPPVRPCLTDLRSLVAASATSGTRILLAKITSDSTYRKTLEPISNMDCVQCSAHHNPLWPHELAGTVAHATPPTLDFVPPARHRRPAPNPTPSPFRHGPGISTVYPALFTARSLIRGRSAERPTHESGRPGRGSMRRASFDWSSLGTADQIAVSFRRG